MQEGGTKASCQTNLPSNRKAEREGLSGQAGNKGGTGEGGKGNQGNSRSAGSGRRLKREILLSLSENMGEKKNRRARVQGKNGYVGGGQSTGSEQTTKAREETERGRTIPLPSIPHLGHEGVARSTPG